MCLQPCTETALPFYPIKPLLFPNWRKTSDLKVRPHYKLKIHCKYRQTPLSMVSVIRNLVRPEKNLEN